MQKVKVTNQVFRRSTVAFALLSALVGQVAIAAVSTNTVGPIYGHQIQLNGDPTLVGTGAVGTQVTATLPSVTDADNDPLVGWQYVWKLDGVEVAPPTTVNDPSPPLAYTVQPADVGKKLELCVNAVADARSYPSPTAISAQNCSTASAVLLKAGIRLDSANLVVVKNNAVANNSDANEVMARLVDGAGNPVAGQTLLFSNETVRYDQSLVTDADGYAVFKPVSSQSGDQTISVMPVINGLADMNQLISVQVTFIPLQINKVAVVDDKGNVVSGNPLVGTVLHTLVATNVSTEDPNGTLDRTNVTYQWERNDKALTGGTVDNWVPIAGETGPTYTTTGKDQGYEIRVDVNK